MSCYECAWLDLSSQFFPTTVIFSSSYRIKPAQRSKRGFKFHERGKFQQIAQRIRAKVQYCTLHDKLFVTVLYVLFYSKNVNQYSTADTNIQSYKP